MLSLTLFGGNQGMLACVHVCDLVNMQFYVLKKYYSSLLNSIRAHALILCVKCTKNVPHFSFWPFTLDVVQTAFSVCDYL